MPARQIGNSSRELCTATDKDHCISLPAFKVHCLNAHCSRTGSSSRGSRDMVVEGMPHCRISTSSFCGERKRSRRLSSVLHMERLSRMVLSEHFTRILLFGRAAKCCKTAFEPPRQAPVRALLIVVDTRPCIGEETLNSRQSTYREGNKPWRSHALGCGSNY